MSDYVIGYHFAADTLRDGSPLPRAGDALPTLYGVELCSAGMYHSSERAIDALRYAPGPRVAIVRVYQRVLRQADKSGGQRRDTLTGYVDVSDVLRDCARLFARRCAQHYPGTMDDCVIHWLWDAHEPSRSAALESAVAAAESAESRSATWAAESATRAAESVESESATWAVWSAAAGSRWSVAAAEWAPVVAVAWEAWVGSRVSELRWAQNIALEMRINEALGVVHKEDLL